VADRLLTYLHVLDNQMARTFSKYSQIFILPNILSVDT